MGVVFVGTCIENAEILFLGKSFKSQGIFGGPILRTRSRRSLYFRWLFVASSHKYLSLFVLFASVSAFSFVLFRQFLYAALTIILLLAGRLLRLYRTPFGGDGSDQMLTTVWIGLSIQTYLLYLGYDQTSIGFVAIAFQGALSYAVAGIAKLLSAEWRSGRALKLIFRTYCYGNQRVLKVVQRHSLFAPIAAAGIILFECLFPLSLLSFKVALPFAILGVLFHSFNAIYMRLNIFFFAFVATYPSILYLSIHQR